MQSSFYSINCRGKILDLSKPKIMGILNLTPDSFSDGGQFNNEKSALIQTEKMLKEGASIIDIGPQSTRPKAAFLSSEEEINRLGNTISTIKKQFPEALISIDTFYGKTVDFAYNEGVDLVNDISAGQFDETLLKTVAKTELPYILMHINPTYVTMHNKIIYDNITVTINEFFSQKVEELYSLGIKDVILDPGFGFGKTVKDQHTMINETQFFGFGRFPLLIGISRKSFIYQPLGKKPLEIGEETQKLHRKVLEKGAKILRVHDVAETQKTIDEFLDSY